MTSIEPWENFQVARYLEYHYPGLIIWFRAIPTDFQRTFLKECRTHLIHASLKLFKLERIFSHFFPAKYILRFRKINTAPDEWLNRTIASINNLNLARSNLEWLHRYLLWIHKVTKSIAQGYSLYCAELSDISLKVRLPNEYKLEDNCDRMGVLISMQYCERSRRKVIKSNHFVIDEYDPPKLTFHFECH